jgi:hypothetical protein
MSSVPDSKMKMSTFAELAGHVAHEDAHGIVGSATPS